MSKLYYTDTHEWVEVNGDTATIGLTTFALEQLGDLVFIELPEVDDSFSQGDNAAVVESVKAASDVYASISGVVTETNGALADDAASADPESPHDCWLFKMTIADASELEQLLDEAAYQEKLND